MFSFLSRNIIILILSLGYLVVSYMYDASLVTLATEREWYITTALLVLHAVVLFFTMFSLLSLLKYIKLRGVEWFFSKFYNKKITKKLLEATEKTYFLFSFLVSLIISLFVMRGLIESSWLSGAVLTSSIIFVTYTVTSFLRIWLTTKTQEILDDKNPNGTLIKFFSKFLIVLIWITGLFVLLISFGYDTSNLLAGAGIWGLAIALAAQKSITNVFGAINIIVNKPLVIGDWVRIWTQEWSVADIGLSYLTVIDPLGHTVMIPNEAILTSNIENYSKREQRRTNFVLGIVYSTPLEKVREWVDIIKTILEKYREAWELTEDIRVNFDMFNAYSLDIKVTYFSLVLPIQEYAAQKEKINLEIKEQFEKADIEMAFPTQEYIIKNESKK